MPRTLRGLGALLIVGTLVGLLGSTWASGGARAGQATPVASGEGDGLAAMLGLAPARDAEAYQTGVQLAAYADLAAQFAATGVPRPASFADDEATTRAIGVLSTLALPEELRQSLVDAEWLPFVGFAPSQVDQILQLGSANGSLTLLRGRFDTEVIRATLVQNGYREVDAGGLTAWTIGEDGRPSLTGSGVQFGFSGLNNVAVLPDGTLVAASTLDGIRAVLAVQTGMAPSLAEDAAVAEMLVVVPPDLVGAVILPGEIVAAANTSGGAPLDGPPLPAIRLVLVGITPGGPVRDFTRPEAATPEATPVQIAGNVAARLVIGAVFADPGTAAAAAPIIAARLLQTSGLNPALTYAELLGEPVVTTPGGGSTVLIETRFGELQPGGWQLLLFAGDLGFLLWEE